MKDYKFVAVTQNQNIIDTTIFPFFQKNHLPMNKSSLRKH